MPKSTLLSSPFSRFQKADQPTKNRIIGASFGMPGTGKTSFWLGAPGPIILFSFDKGLEGVVEKFQDTKDIYVAEYDWSPTEDLDQEEAITLRDKFTEDFEHAIEVARTVLIDKETDLWELFRYAEFGAPKDAPLNYPALNQRYRRLINLPKSTDINFGITQGMKERWVKKVNARTGAQGAAASGEFERAGFKEIEGLMHVNLFHERKRNPEPNKPSVFTFEVGKSRGPGAPDVQDQTFENLSFVDFAQLVFPDSTEEDWQ